MYKRKKIFKKTKFDGDFICNIINTTHARNLKSHVYMKKLLVAIPMYSNGDHSYHTYYWHTGIMKPFLGLDRKQGKRNKTV